jgi:CYTH domain-containing protein
VTEGPLEIERKYLLAHPPSPAALAAHGARPFRIEQVYLAEPPSGRRVRRIEGPDGTVSFRATTKTHLRDLVRRELEREIDEAAYRRLLLEADPTRRPIRKVRYVVPHGEQHLEIDVFEQPAGLVLLEVELRSEDEVVRLPRWLGEHRDVSRDPRYANASLAQAGIPDQARGPGRARPSGYHPLR